MRKKSNFITTPKSSPKKNKKHFITVVLLSENHGYRMKSKGAIPLVDINGTTLLDRQINAIKAVFQNFEIILCCGYDSGAVFQHVKEKYKALNIRIVENQVYENSNCCESARLAINNTLNNKIILCSGSVLLLAEHLRAIDLDQSSILIQPASKKLEDFNIGVVSQDEKVKNMSLQTKIEEKLNESLKNKDKNLYPTLRLIVSAIKDAVIANRTKENKNLNDQARTIKHHITPFRNSGL